MVLLELGLQPQCSGDETNSNQAVMTVRPDKTLFSSSSIKSNSRKHAASMQQDKHQTDD
jgi:hypothetical protein